MTTTFASAATKTVLVDGLPFVYREVGEGSTVPLLLLNHLTGVLDDWDPAVVDGLAERHRVIAFDNRGVGASGGATPHTIAEMASDAVAFIDALGLATVDLLGFSLGGFIAQTIALDRPDLVRRIILAGSGPADGEGIGEIGAVLQRAIQQASAGKKHPKHFLFFSQSELGQEAADAFLGRLGTRMEERDTLVTNETIQAHVAAVHGWGNGAAPARSVAAIKQPVLVVNGDKDVMVPTVNSLALFRALPHAELSIFPDSGHGGIFQHHREFVAQALRFLSSH